MSLAGDLVFTEPNAIMCLTYWDKAFVVTVVVLSRVIVGMLWKAK